MEWGGKKSTELVIELLFIFRQCAPQICQRASQGLFNMGLSKFQMVPVLAMNAPECHLSKRDCHAHARQYHKETCTFTIDCKNSPTLLYDQVSAGKWTGLLLKSKASLRAAKPHLWRWLLVHNDKVSSKMSHSVKSLYINSSCVEKPNPLFLTMYQHHVSGAQQADNLGSKRKKC